MELADRNLWDRFRECERLACRHSREELLRYMQEAAEALDLIETRSTSSSISIYQNSGS